MGRGPGVRATSATSIQIDFTWKGKRCRERVALPPTPRNLAWAKRKKQAIEYEIATGTFDYGKHFPDSPRARVSTGAPLDMAVKRYLDGLEGSVEFETLREYRRCAKLFLADFPGATVESLSRPDFRDWAARKKLSKKRLDNLLIPIRGFYKQANDDGITEHNPVQGFQIRRVSEPKEQIDPFTPAEVEALGRTELGYLWTFWAWTGLRSGELIGLEWRDVDAGMGSITIRRAVRVGREKKPKTAAGVRECILLPASRAALPRATAKVGPVFRNPNTGDGWYEDRALARAFRKACEAAGVRYRYPYQLRHTFATWALSSGENPRWIATYMGHRDVMMLFRVYGKWMPSMDPKAGSRMAESAKSKAA